MDLELESAESLKKGDLQRLRDSGIGMLISHHDFNGTRDLDDIFSRIDAFHPDFIKIVPTAKSLIDNLTLIRFLERMSDHSNIIGICMGDAGIISRVLGVRAGSAFTFAAATLGEETGPGQIAARTLIETYRIDQVDAATKVYGVAGNPIRSSLSPIMMNTAFRRETVNAVYLALQTTKLSDLIKLVHEIPIQGISVTMPLKQDILDASGAHRPALGQDWRVQHRAARAGRQAIRLQHRCGGHHRPAGEAHVAGRGKGAGAGSGRRCTRRRLWPAREGRQCLYPEPHRRDRAEAGTPVRLHTIRKDALAKTSFDAIINATPVGMAGNKAAPLLEAKDLNTKLVFDLVYNPLETPLIHLARQMSIPIITGIEMFVHQGARQFEIWTGKPAPEEEMFRVVLHALRQRAEADSAEAAEEKPEVKAKPVASPVAKPKPEAKAKTVAKPAKKATAKPAAKKVVVNPTAKKAAKKVSKTLPKAKPAAKKSTAKAKK